MNFLSVHWRRGPVGSLVLAVSLLASAQVQADEALAKKNGCTACHAIAVKVMGPSFRDVAGKYAGNSEAVETLSRSIREGGTGRWGAFPMPPQTQLSPGAVKALATWIAAGAK